MRNTKTTCEVCSKLTVETPERRQGHRSGVFIFNLEQISFIILLFSVVNFEQVKADWNSDVLQVILLSSSYDYSLKINIKYSKIFKIAFDI